MTHWMEGDWPEKYEIEDDRDKALKSLIAKIRHTIACLPSYSLGDVADDAIGELESLADEIAGRYESDDPRMNGWISDSGLP